MGAKKLRRSSLSLGISLALGSLAIAVAPSAIAAPNVSVFKELEHSNSVPASMCFTMSSRQVISSEIDNLRKFLELKDSKGMVIDGAPSIVNDALCVGNLTNGGSYSLTFKKGLRFASGDRLSESFDHNFNISDAASQIRMPYNIILPKNGQNSSFTIKTLNQPSVKLAIYRIPKEYFQQQSLSNYLDNNLSDWILIDAYNKGMVPVYEKIFDLSSDKSVDVFNLTKEAQLALNKDKPESGDSSANNEYEQLNAKLNQEVSQASRAQLVEDKLNKELEINVNLEDFVRKSEDGFYMILAYDPRIDLSNGISYDTVRGALPFTSKFMVITDFGVSTYQSPDVILANVRSLTSAKALKDISVDLIAYSGEVLSSAKTDENGVVRFGREFISGKNSMEPIELIVKSDSDYYVVNLKANPFYIEGNNGYIAPSDYQAYAYTERGIYRQGETMHYTALVRNSHLQALNLPLTLKITNSQGSEIHKVLLNTSYQGGYEYDFAIPQGTINGRYNATLYLGDRALTSTPFTIGSYVPTQINSKIMGNDNMLAINSPVKLRSQTNFNYGGAASNLNGNFTVSIYPDPKPVPALANALKNEHLDSFHFGPDAKDYSKLVVSEGFYNLKTDVQGVLQASMVLPGADFPQKANVTSQVVDTNGQLVAVNKEYKVAYNRPLIGVRKLENGADNSNVNFALCSYLQDGSTYPQSVKYYLYKQFVDYNYVYEDGAWRYVSFVSRNLVSNGSVKVDNQNLDQALISTPLDDGSYVLELESDKSKTSLSFVRGFMSSSDANTPDRVMLYADKESYNIGDKVKLSFESPFDGYANLALGNRGIDDFKTFEIKKGHNEVSIEITEDLAPQGHALLSIFSPLNTNKVGSIRAVGICDINLDLNSHKFKVVANVPSEIKPQSKLNVSLSATPSAIASDGHVSVGGKAYAKVTLVDNGILSLTNYKSPDPNKVFMQDQGYDVTLIDPYGLIMTDPKQQGQGYGEAADAFMMNAAGATSLQTVPHRTIALASKIVPLNDLGEAQVEFDIPQFSGSLKVMAVAWDQDKVGAANSDVLIRDNAVATIGLPRYLNVGDSVQGRLNLHNLKAKNPEFKVDISCSGVLKCSMQTVSSLKPGIREDKFFDIKALDSGVGKINLTVMNQDFNLTDSYDLTVTSPQLPMLKNYVEFLNPNESVTYDVATNFNNVDASLISWSTLPNVNPRAFVMELSQGGYGGLSSLVASLEGQLLYGKELIATQEQKQAQAEATNSQEYQDLAALYQNEAQYNEKIQENIIRILARQLKSGSFAENNSYTALYAIDVLLKAQDQGFAVNDTAVNNAFSYLREVASSAYSQTAAYAYEILSRYESVNQAKVRYMLDENKIKRPMLLAHLANSLNQIGDTNRANLALEKAIAGLLEWQQLEEKLYSANKTNEILSILSQIDELAVSGYWSLRQASFAVIDSALRLNRTDLVLDVINSIAEVKASPDYLSDTTMATMLRASTALDSQTKSLSVMLSPEDLKTLLSAAPATADAKDKAAAPAQSAEQATSSEQAIAQAGADSTVVKPSADAPATNQGPAYEVSPGKLKVYNRTNDKLFATTSFLGQYKQDKVIADKGFGVNVNYWTRSGAVDLKTYEFRQNEEVLMEIFVNAKTRLNAKTLIRAKLPAGFEFVRNLAYNDPSFGSLFEEDDTIYQPSSIDSSDDQVVATFSEYDTPNTYSLFLVLRAAHNGTFTQGQAIVQYLDNPGKYGTTINPEPIKISGK